MSNPAEKPDPLKKVNDPKYADTKVQILDQQDRTEKSMKEIEAAYDTEARKIRTPMADYQAANLLSVLTLPLKKLGEEIWQDMLDAKDKLLSEDIMTKHEKRRKAAVDTAIFYIKKMASEGGLNAEAVSRMVSDQNRKASRAADLLILNKDGKYDDLVDAMLFSLGHTGESSSLTAGAQPKAEKTILKYLKSDFDKPNSDLMPFVWSILSFMEKDPKIAITKAYLKGKPAAKVEEFLQRGNAMGVFSGEEMKELNPTKKYTEQDVKDQQINWAAQNDFKKQAAALGITPYGTENAAGKMITIRNAILLFVKLGAGATVIGNFMTGAWQGGKFQGFGKAVKRVTNPQSLGALGLLTAVTVFESKKTFDQLLYGNKDQEEAAVKLRKEKKGNGKWTKWDSFFRAGDFAGARVFFDFVSINKSKIGGGDIDKAAGNIIPSQFGKYLEGMIERKKIGKGDDDNVDYAALKLAFDKIKPEEIMSFAKIFDTLNIGGKNAKDEYEKHLKEPK